MIQNYTWLVLVTFSNGSLSENNGQGIGELVINNFHGNILPFTNPHSLLHEQSEVTGARVTKLF